MAQTGSCLCGEVSFSIAGKIRAVINCHCGECRKFHGNFAPYTQVKRQNITINGEDNISWFHKGEARRGFCKTCGSSLFWDLLSDDNLDIIAGALTSPTGLKTIANIFTDDKSDFYLLPETDANYPGSRNQT